MLKNIKIWNLLVHIVFDTIFMVICLSERISMKKKNINHNQKHLSLSDRSYIEEELLQHSSFKYMGEMLKKDPTTISKEIRNNSCSKSPIKHIRKCKGCANFKACMHRHVCGDLKCNSVCRLCIYGHPIEHCADFLPYDRYCFKLNKPPYVCNGCPNSNLCTLEQRVYDAKRAQKKYEQTLSDSRRGINMSQEELEELNELISPLVLKGQPLSHIFAVHADDIPVCRRTLYNYFDQHIFTARNIDLPRRVRYKKRKSAQNLVKEIYSRHIVLNVHMLISKSMWPLFLIWTLSKWILLRVAVTQVNAFLHYFSGAAVL